MDANSEVTEETQFTFMKVWASTDIQLNMLLGIDSLTEYYSIGIWIRNLFWWGKEKFPKIGETQCNCAISHVNHKRRFPQQKEAGIPLRMSEIFHQTVGIIFQDSSFTFSISGVWLKSIKSPLQCQPQDSPDKWNYAKKKKTALAIPGLALASLISTNEIKMCSSGISKGYFS